MREESLWLSVIGGFLTLAVPAIVLILLAIVGSVVYAEALSVAGILIILTLLAFRGLWFELQTIARSDAVESIEIRQEIRIIGALFVGGFITFVLVAEGGLSPVVAASLTGIAAALYDRNLAIPAYCGAFVGMTSPVVFTAYWHGLVAACVAAGVYLLVQPVFHGVGGKLGTTAFVGASLTILGTSEPFLRDPLPEGIVVWMVLFYAMIAAVITYSLHVRGPVDPVFAPGVVGVLGGLGLPAMHPEIGGLLAAAIYAASFAGMSDPSRIPSEGWMMVSGIAVGLIVVYTSPYLGGSGGKLGTIAFVSCLVVYGLIGTIYRVVATVQYTTLPREDIT